MKKERFELTGSFYGQSIENKTIVYSGGDLNLTGCTLKNCDPVVEGDAADGVNFMKAMFNAGMKCSVMKTFLTDDEYEKVKKVLGWDGIDGN